MDTIRIEIQYVANTKASLERFIERYAKEVDRTLQDVLIKKDREDPRTFYATFFTSCDGDSDAGKVYDILTLANKLWSSGSGGWTFNGPHNSNGLSFECNLQNIGDDQPLTSATIRWGE